MSFFVFPQTDSLSVFVDWSIDSPGLLFLRDFVQPGTPPLEPAGDWCGAALCMEPVTSFIEGSDVEPTGTGPWYQSNGKERKKKERKKERKKEERKKKVESEERT